MTDAALHVLGWECVAHCYLCGAMIERKDAELHAAHHDEVDALRRLVRSLTALACVTHPEAMAS